MPAIHIAPSLTRATAARTISLIGLILHFFLFFSLQYIDLLISLLFSLHYHHHHLVLLLVPSWSRNIIIASPLSHTLRFNASTTIFISSFHPFTCHLWTNYTLPHSYFCQTHFSTSTFFFNLRQSIRMPNLFPLLPMYTIADPNPVPKPFATEMTQHHASMSATSLSRPVELLDHHIDISATPASPSSHGLSNTNEQARVDSSITGLDTIGTEDSQRDIHPALRKPAPVFHRVPMPRQAIAGMDGAEDANTMSGALPDE